MKRMIATGVLIVAMLPMLASAQTRASAGYVHVDGKNRHGGEGWASVDDGSGLALAIRHDWEQFYVGMELQALTLRNRNHLMRPPAPLFPPSLYEYDYDDRFRGYRFKAGWKHSFSARWNLWVESGIAHERWSNSNGTLSRYLPSGELFETSVLFDLDTNETSLFGGAGIEFLPRQSTTLNVGLSYQHRSYYAVVPSNFLGGDPARPESLVEGVARLSQRFGERFEGFVEYRPSDQRQFVQVGVGYVFR